MPFFLEIAKLLGTTKSVINSIVTNLSYSDAIRDSSGTLIVDSSGYVNIILDPETMGPFVTVSNDVLHGPLLQVTYDASVDPALSNIIHGGHMVIYMKMLSPVSENICYRIVRRMDIPEHELF